MNKIVVQRLLALKSKAAQDEEWSLEDFGFVEACLKRDVLTRTLAAACILSCGQTCHFPSALRIMRSAVKRLKLPPYVVLSVCEALVFVETKAFLPFSQDIVAFVWRVVQQRTIHLENALCILGKLSMAGEEQASELLDSLSHDADPKIRQIAAKVIAANSRGGHAY